MSGLAHSVVQSDLFETIEFKDTALWWVDATDKYIPMGDAMTIQRYLGTITSLTAVTRSRW